MNKTNTNTPERLLARIRAGSKDDAGCWVWTGCLDGKCTPKISVNCRPVSVRRVAWESTNGKAPVGYEVVPTCETPLCVNPEHTKIVTVTERRQMMAAVRNLKHSSAQINAARARGKLSMEIARAIRASSAQGKDLAQQYGVSHTLISYVRQGKSWAEPTPWSGLGERRA